MPSAGEVEQFGYCAHNWWLAQKGTHGGQGAGSRRGVAEHQRLGEEQQHAEGHKRDYKQGVTWSFRLLLVAGSVTFLTLELVFLRAHPQHILFLTMALVLVSASSGTMVIALDAQRRLKKVEQKGELIVSGDLLDSDLQGKGKLLHDPDWGVTGTPDYILDTPGGPVPVEVKTGHTPNRPYPNHVLQVSCYMRLLDAAGKPPAYGLINYPDGVFRVAWGDQQKAELKAVLGRMEQAKAEGRADRDHDVPGRCKGCARRDACEQRLA
jgi:CRISPR/Cas system-associated exonuclease Cas4 (RecB family)